MERIENFVLKFIDARNAQYGIGCIEYKERILSELRRNSIQLCYVKHRYIVCKALVYILSEMDKDQQDYDIFASQTYYSLLKNTLQILENGQEDTNATELAATSMMAFTILAENLHHVCFFVMNSIGISDVETALKVMWRMLYFHYWIYRQTAIHTFVDEELNERYNKAFTKYSSLETSPSPTRGNEAGLRQDAEFICSGIASTFSCDGELY